MKRLFFALWPDDETRGHCVKLVDALVCREGRAVQPGNLHVTLAFLGNVDAATELLLTEAASEIQMSTSAIVFDQLEFWRKPGILCLSSRNPVSPVTSLAISLTEMAAQFGVPVDERPFAPHVTLVRKAKRSVQMEFEPIVWPVDSFCLVESCGLPEGVEYRVIKRW